MANLMQCEWCDATATVRLKVGDWVRFACRNTAHSSKVRKLADIDCGGSPAIETYICGDGFLASSGRPVGLR